MKILAFLFACYEIYSIILKYSNIDIYISKFDKVENQIKNLNSDSGHMLQDFKAIIKNNKDVSIEIAIQIVYLLFIIRLIFSHFFVYGICMLVLTIAEAYLNKNHNKRFYMIDSALCMLMLLSIASR